MTNSEDQRLNVSLDRYFIIQRQKLGKYVGNYGAEDTAFLTCYKSRLIHPVLTQIGSGKHPKLDKQAICIFIPHTFNAPTFKICDSDRPRSLGSQCHILRLSAILSCLMSQLAPKQYFSLLILRHKSKFIFGQASVLSDISCFSALHHFRLMSETENRKIYQEELRNSILLFPEVFIAKWNSADRLQLSVTQFLLVGVIFSDSEDKREEIFKCSPLHVFKCLSC